LKVASALLPAALAGDAPGKYQEKTVGFCVEVLMNFTFPPSGTRVVDALNRAMGALG
jgi:hypothetical protein